MAMFSNVGPTLILLRELRGKSQVGLARQARIGKSQLSKYENNRELPKLESLEKLLNALRVSYFEFFYTLCLVDRRAADLDRETKTPGEPPLYMPPFPQGETLLAETTDQAFSQLFADVSVIYRRVLDQIVLSGVPRPKERRGRGRRTRTAT